MARIGIPTFCILVRILFCTMFFFQAHHAHDGHHDHDHISHGVFQHSSLRSILLLLALSLHSVFEVGMIFKTNL